MCVLSIIIPVYNAEQYLETCVNSILEQCVEDIQIILVNDGSSDKSGEICEKYSKDIRVTYFKQKNQGVSAARNIGLRLATGKYIMFADADDYFSGISIREVMKSVENNVESSLWVFDYAKVNQKGETSVVHLMKGTYSKNDYLKLILSVNPAIYFNKIYNKVYLRKNILDNNIMFPQEKRIGEDLIFNLEYLSCCDVITCVPEHFYYYRIDNNNSLMHSKEVFNIDNFCENINIVVSTILHEYSSDKMHIKKNLDIYLLNAFNSFAADILRRDSIKKAYAKIAYVYQELYKLEVNEFRGVKYKYIMKFAWKKKIPWLLILRLLIIEKRYRGIVLYKESILKIKIALHKSINFLLKKYPYKILDTKNSIDYILNNKTSLCRFGEGEINLLARKQDLKFQKYDSLLAERMKQILKSERKDITVAIPYAIKNYSHMNERAQLFWKEHLSYATIDWFKYTLRHKYYLDSLMTRCYLDLESKQNTPIFYEKWKRVWKGKDIVIVEGINSRLGVGNDLFQECKSIKRVLCPAENAFSCYDKILQCSLTFSKDSLFLIALGPTAAILAYDLACKGYQALDVGHIDIEYEWYKMRTEVPVKVNGKYTNEVSGGNDVEKIISDEYEKQIIEIVE